MAANAQDNRMLLRKGIPSKAACVRCRGQKLRCIWGPEETQCQRCARANTTCTIPPPRSMGRPPRQNRSASIHTGSGPNRGHSQGLYSWAEENTPAPGPGDESADIPMTPDKVLSNTLDFPPWIPELEGLNLFAPGGPLGAALAIPLAMTNSGVNVDANQLFSLHHEAFIPTVSDPSNGTLVVADTTSHRDMAKDDDHMQFSTDENGDSQIRLLTQLCELNVALYQHPLHREKDQATSRTTAAWENTTQSQAGDAQSAQNNSNRSHDLNLGDLGTGSLFKLTCRLKDTVTQIRALDEKTPKGPRRYDRPTALMALSCYTRLDVLYSRALEILMLARNTGPAANGTHNQMPELVIDGFSMGQCLDLQLNFLIDLHKQASDRIRACIRIAEGTTSVAQEC